MLPRALAALSVFLSASCAVDESNPESGLYYVNSRTFEAVSWDTVANIGGGLSDTILVMPQVVAADDGVLFVYDASDSRVRAIGPAGDLLWTYGRRGEGPGEFMNVIDMEVGPDATLWLLDGGTNRLTVLHQDGSWLRSIPITGVRTRDIIPGDSIPLLLTVASDDFLIVVDSTGAILRRAEAPTPEIGQASPLVRQTLASGSSRGEPGTERIWATIFPFGHPLVVYEGERVRCSARLIEASEFPEELVAESIISGLAVATTDSAVHVLGRGRTADARRIIDIYSPQTCQYVKSLRLPGEFTMMALADGAFYLYAATPIPRVLALRPRTGNR